MYLLDTNAVSSLVRDAQGPIAVRADLVGHSSICTSIIVAAEVSYGVSKRPSPRLVERVHGVLDRLSIYDFGPPAEAIYGSVRAELERRGQTIGQIDLLIAANALALDCILVTDNAASFEGCPTCGSRTGCFLPDLHAHPLDSAALRRHFACSEHDAFVREVEKAAAQSGAPFLAANAPLAKAWVRWSRDVASGPSGSECGVGVSEVEGG